MIYIRIENIGVHVSLSSSPPQQDTLREDCDSGDDCVLNCCVNAIIAPVFFVIFVLMAQFVLVNVVVAVLMKHLQVVRTHYCEPVIA